MAQAQNVLWIIQQAMTELGLDKPVTALSSGENTVQQFVSLLNSAGQEMVLGYPWEQLTKEWVFTTTANQDEYDLPADWSYLLDQTQWDRTNHWPLLGPKTAQEWQWLKGGLLSSGPRLRYRLRGGKFIVFPKPTSATTPWNLGMEYVADTWLEDGSTSGIYYSAITNDTDISLLDPWVLVKFIKLKFRQAKGLDATSFSQDFVSIWETRIGKNKGAPVLTLAPRPRTLLIGINNIPDGSWNVGSP